MVLYLTCVDHGYIDDDGYGDNDSDNKVNYLT